MAAKIILSVLFVSFLSAEVTSLDGDVRRAVTVATTTTPKPVMCVHCTDLGCYTSPVSSACVSVTEPYCISTVTDHSSGTRDIVKGCATFATCSKAYNTTSREVRCRGIEHQVSGFDFTCSYCCKGDNCNAGPQLKTTLGVQFVGKAIVG